MLERSIAKNVEKMYGLMWDELTQLYAKVVDNQYIDVWGEMYAYRIEDGVVTIYWQDLKEDLSYRHGTFKLPLTATYEDVLATMIDEFVKDWYREISN